MDLTGEYRIPAPRETVWAALNNPEVLKAAIPGCQELEKLSDTEFQATAKVSVGPVKATFKGGVTLTDLDPPFAGPKRMRISLALVVVPAAIKAALIRGNFPSLTNPACSATPIIVPVVSKSVTKRKAKISA